MRAYGAFFGCLGLACLLAAAGPGCGDDDDGAPAGGPRLRAEWPTVWFDSVRGRAESEPLSVRVTNDGTGDAPTLVTNLVGDVGAFRIVNDGCAGRTLSPLRTCSITLAFGATEVGPFEGALRVWSAAALGQPGLQLELPLWGKMANAELRATADQPSKDVGLGASAAFTITVENAGGLPSGPIALGDAGPFALSGGCEGRRLAGGETCTVTATYDAPAGGPIGPVGARINVEAEPGGAAGVDVVANVIDADALSVPDVDFGAVATGTSVVKTVTVSNPSTREAAVTGVSVVSALPDFSDVVIDRDQCTGITLAPQASCELDVRLVSSYRLEPIDATLTVQSDALLPGVGRVRGTRVRAYFAVSALLDAASTGTGAAFIGGSGPFPLPLGYVGENGSTLTLRAAPDAGSVFLGWSGACSGTADCVLSPPNNADVEVKLLFGAAP